MLVETTVSSHRTPARTAATTERTGAGEHVEKSGPSRPIGGNASGMQPLWKPVRRFKNNLKQNYHVFQQPHSWVSIQRKENANLERHLLPHVRCSGICNMETTSVHGETMDRENVSYGHTIQPGGETEILSFVTTKGAQRVLC